MPDIAKALRSFRYALTGVAYFFKSENNAKIHLIAACSAVLVAIWLGLSSTEWCILVIQISLVFAAEAFNTAIEKLCDRVSPTHHPLIGTVKDVAAGAVLITAAASVVTGLILFLPKL